jgi:hypothetical protein
MAPRVLPQLVRVLAPGCVPLFVTDGCKAYTTALLSHGGHGVHPARHQAKGPRAQPRWMPLPELRYAQVVQSSRRRRLGGAHTAWCAAPDWPSNRSWRRVAGRSTRPASSGFTSTSASAGRRWDAACTPCAEAQRAYRIRGSQTYHNLVRPHASLRPPLGVPEATHGTGSAQRGRPCTPAMAAGLTDHVWTLQEVRLFRVPPWPQSQTVYNRMLVEDRGGEPLACAPREDNRGERGVAHQFGGLMTG